MARRTAAAGRAGAPACGSVEHDQGRAGPAHPACGSWWRPREPEARMEESIRTKILALLDQHRDMSIATLRPDGWPQATTVGYGNDGLTLYFLCGRGSQKSANLAHDDRV